MDDVTRPATDEERAEWYARHRDVYTELAFSEGMEAAQTEVLLLAGYNGRLATLLRKPPSVARDRSIAIVIGFIQDSRERLRTAGLWSSVSREFTELANTMSF